MDKTKVTAAEG